MFLLFSYKFALLRQIFLRFPNFLYQLQPRYLPYHDTLVGRVMPKFFWNKFFLNDSHQCSYHNDLKIGLFVGYFLMGWVLIRAGVYCPHIWAQLVYFIKIEGFSMHICIAKDMRPIFNDSLLLSHPVLGWLYVFSPFPPRPPCPLRPRPQKLFPLTSKPYELNLWYLAQRIYGSGELYWVTFPWPWPKVAALVSISPNVLVCAINWESLIGSLQKVTALLL